MEHLQNKSAPVTAYIIAAVNSHSLIILSTKYIEWGVMMCLHGT